MLNPGGKAIEHICVTSSVKVKGIRTSKRYEIEQRYHYLYPYCFLLLSLLVDTFCEMGTDVPLNFVLCHAMFSEHASLKNYNCTKVRINRLLYLF